MAEWLALRDVAVRPVAGRGVALCTDAKTLDHPAFRARAAQWRAAFAAQTGQHWALHFEDTADFLPALYGAWHAGKTVVLCADVSSASITALRSSVDGFAGDFLSDCAPISADASIADAGDHWPALDEQTTRLQVFTSGSTGAAVAIEKSLAQLAREVEALQATFAATVQDAVVHGTVSHQHIYGLLFRALWPLAAGRVIAQRLFFHEEIVAALTAPALLVSSPAHLKRLPMGVDWSAAGRLLCAVFSSGGVLPDAAAQEVAARLGHAPIEIYGSSETGGIAWRRNAGDAPAWKPLPGVRWRISEDGLLDVDSPHLPEAGWWRSADRVENAGGGNFRLLGRADRIVKVEERRVSLTALEQALMALPEVAEARVLLLDDGARAVLAAVVVAGASGVACLRASGRRGLSRRLKQALAEGRDATTRPRRWRFVSAMPVTAQGKTTEAALRALFRPEQPRAAWLLREARHAVIELDITPELLAFDGHFPQVPILPGVAQLDWAIRLGREAFSLPPHVLRMEALKFQRVVRPGLVVRLELDWLPEKSALVFRYASEQGPHASGRAILTGEDA